MASYLNSIYTPTSPYYLTSVVNQKYLDIMVNRGIPSLGSDVLWSITLQYEYRPDMLAYDLYNDPRLWWVFAQRNPNRLKDPYFDFIAGLEIYIPNINTINQALGL